MSVEREHDMNEIPGGLRSFSSSTSGPGLGSLSQSARKQSLRGARSILILIGVLTMLLNGFMLAQSEFEVNEAVSAELRSRGLSDAQVDHAKLEEARTAALRLTQLIYGGTVGLGLVFVALGAMIYRAPVAMTVTGMVLYIASAIVFALLDPTSLVRGIIIKVIIIATMAKAISAAVAYQRSQTAAVTA
jgi:hypothetical protein